MQYTRVDPQTHKRVAAFVDSGDKVTIQDWRKEATIAAAMALSAQKWDAITVAGSNEYKALAVRIAAREGYALTNPELQEPL